jgi:hypothetical protein
VSERVAQTSKSAVSQVSKPAEGSGNSAASEHSTRSRFGNRRYGRFGNLRYIAVAFVFILFVCRAAASPEIEGASTFALKSHGETELTILGSSLRETASLWLSVPATAKLVGEPRDNHVKFRVALNTNVSRVVWARVVASNGISNVRAFVVDDLRSKVASKTNKSRAAAQTIITPVAIEGAMEELAVAWFKISAKKRERVTLEVVATRLGSPLDSVLRVVDSRGREIASNDDAPGIRGDSVLIFEAPDAGDYFVELRDVNYGGGRDFFYRLRVGAEPLARTVPITEQTEREPNNTARSATPIKVPCAFSGRFDSANDVDVFRFNAEAKRQLSFRARTRSIGAGCDVMLRVESAKGEVLAKSNASAADEGVVTHTFGEAGDYRLVVQEVTGAFGPAAFYLVEASEAAGFTLMLDSDRAEASAGGSVKLKVNCVRGGYKGPVVLALDGLSTTALTDNVIPQNKTNVTLTATLPTNFLAGTAHAFMVIGSAQSKKNAPAVTASTAPTWQKSFPQMLYAPLDLEPFVTLGVTSK